MGLELVDLCVGGVFAAKMGEESISYTFTARTEAIGITLQPHEPVLAPIHSPAVHEDPVVHLLIARSVVHAVVPDNENGVIHKAVALPRQHALAVMLHMTRSQYRHLKGE